LERIKINIIKNLYIWNITHNNNGGYYEVYKIQS